MSEPIVFLLFQMDDYYPCGGWSDLTHTCSTLRQAIESIDSNHDWFQIVNVVTMQKVLEGENAQYQRAARRLSD
jgi:hypothetical protein